MKKPISVEVGFLFGGIVASIQRFEDIEAWMTARELTRVVYEMTSKGAFGRDFGLRDQIRRAAVSAMSNIAEGFESRTRTLFIDFLGRAKGSAGEVRSQAYVALDAKMIAEDQFNTIVQLAERCSRQITGFMTYLSRLPK